MQEFVTLVLCFLVLVAESGHLSCPECSVEVPSGYALISLVFVFKESMQSWVSLSCALFCFCFSNRSVFLCNLEVYVLDLVLSFVLVWGSMSLSVSCVSAWPGHDMYHVLSCGEGSGGHASLQSDTIGFSGWWCC